MITGVLSITAFLINLGLSLGVIPFSIFPLWLIPSAVIPPITTIISSGPLFVTASLFLSIIHIWIVSFIAIIVHWRFGLPSTRVTSGTLGTIIITGHIVKHEDILLSDWSHVVKVWRSIESSGSLAEAFALLGKHPFSPRRHYVRSLETFVFMDVFKTIVFFNFRLVLVLTVMATTSIWLPASIIRTAIAMATSGSPRLVGISSAVFIMMVGTHF